MINYQRVSYSYSYWCVLRREWMGMGVAGIIITSDEMDYSLIPCV